MRLLYYSQLLKSQDHLFTKQPEGWSSCWRRAGCESSGSMIDTDAGTCLPPAFWRGKQPARLASNRTLINRIRTASVRTWGRNRDKHQDLETTTSCGKDSWNEENKFKPWTLNTALSQKSSDRVILLQGFKTLINFAKALKYKNLQSVTSLRIDVVIHTFSL